MENQKDELFYNDLIYRLKQLAGFELKENEEIEDRIEKREELIDEIIDGVKTNAFYLSEFQVELFQIIMNIVKKANGNFTGLKEIANYPELVSEQIAILEGKISLLQSQKVGSDNPVLTKKKKN